MTTKTSEDALWEKLLRATCPDFSSKWSEYRKHEVLEEIFADIKAAIWDYKNPGGSREVEKGIKDTRVFLEILHSYHHKKKYAALGSEPGAKEIVAEVEEIINRLVATRQATDEMAL